MLRDFLFVLFVYFLFKDLNHLANECPVIICNS